MSERRNDLEITNETPQNCFCRSQTRIDLLFTMSDITHAAVHPDCACELMFRGRLFEALSIFDLIWWSQTGSNRRPHACKARALPAELWPRTRRRILLVARPVRSPSPALRRGSLVQEGLPSRSCRAAKAGGPGKT